MMYCKSLLFRFKRPLAAMTLAFAAITPHAVQAADGVLPSTSVGSQTAPAIENSPAALTPNAPGTLIYDGAVVNGNYVLGPGDNINVKVLPQDKYSIGALPINQDGTINYPVLGTIPAAGESVDQLTKDLQTRLSQYCIAPDVTVTLTALRPQVVYVSGGVASPKVLDVHAASSLAKAITLSGGATNIYSLSRVVVMRQDQLLTANVYPLMINGVDNGQNLALKPGDLVIVPTNTARVTVVGAVSKPGMIALADTSVSAEGPMRLSDAISSAGGATPGARVGEITLVRQAPVAGAQPRTTRYDYGRFIHKGDITQDPVLQDNDVVVVPDAKHSNTANLLGSISGLAILQTFTHL